MIIKLATSNTTRRIANASTKIATRRTMRRPKEACSPVSSANAQRPINWTAPKATAMPINR